VKQVTETTMATAKTEEERRQRYETVEKMRTEGHTYAEIAHVLGVTTTRVRQIWLRTQRIKKRGEE
jgi:DNA-directed RNA polymerase sigma subunit (sigma70/sigma32)